MYRIMDKFMYTSEVKILTERFNDHIHLEKAMKQGETYILKPIPPIPKLSHSHLIHPPCTLYPMRDSKSGYSICMYIVLQLAWREAALSSSVMLLGAWDGGGGAWACSATAQHRSRSA